MGKMGMVAMKFSQLRSSVLSWINPGSREEVESERAMGQWRSDISIFVLLPILVLACAIGGLALLATEGFVPLLLIPTVFVTIGSWVIVRRLRLKRQ